VKIGIFSDIHGSFTGLQRAFALMKMLRVDQIICAGDLVEGEPNNDAVVEAIIEAGIPCVQGNHDHAARGTSDWLLQNPGQWAMEPLKTTSLDYLDALPLMLRFGWEGARVLLTHSSPWDQVTYVFPNGSPQRLKRVASEADADIVILGHTHMPMQVQVGKVTLFNPGSLRYGRVDNRRTCALLSLPDRSFTIYDVDTWERVPCAPVMIDV
jgi:putative phosphoesterase